MGEKGKFLKSYSHINTRNTQRHPWQKQDIPEEQEINKEDREGGGGIGRPIIFM